MKKFQVHRFLFFSLKSKIRNQQSRIRNGFTLVELLIALGISSIIFLVIISTYSSTMRMIEKWGQREEDYYIARNILGRMRNEISSFNSISDADNNTSSEESEIRGDERTFSFYTSSRSLYFPFHCIVKVTYKFTVNDDGKGVLVREEEPSVNFSLEENKYLKSYVWVQDLKDFAFQYSDGEEWHDEWDTDDSSYTLKAVRITLISSQKNKLSAIIYIPTEI